MPWMFNNIKIWDFESCSQAIQGCTLQKKWREASAAEPVKSRVLNISSMKKTVKDFL